jgi:hypothetical protein
MEDIKCSFCGEDGFDLVGLKLHLIRYYDAYTNLNIHGHGIIVSMSREAAEAARKERE